MGGEGSRPVENPPPEQTAEGFCAQNSARSQAFSETVKVVPLPSALSTAIFP